MNFANTSTCAFASRPLGIAAACFACGIFIAHSFQISLPFAVCCGVLTLACAALGVARKRMKLSALMLLASFLFAGMTASLVGEQARNRSERVRSFFARQEFRSDDPVELTGTIARAPEAAPDGFSLLLKIEAMRVREIEQRATGHVRLFAIVTDATTLALYEQLNLRYGARLRVAVRLRRDDGFRNPGVVSYTELLDRQNVDATATIKSPLLIERLDDAKTLAPLAWIYNLRARLLASIGTTFEPDTAAVLNASLLGNEKYLSRAVAERYRIGGTFHVLVISGMHISIIGGFVLLLMRGVTRRRTLQWLIAVLFLWSYSFAVGAESSVMRAALMFSIIALAPVVNRSLASLDPLNTLGAAALALLVWRPEDLFSPSFQLTFLSVFAVLALALPLLVKLRQTGEWQPSANTPRPPVCPRWWRALSEILFWRERAWRREQQQATWSYRLIKTPLAEQLERWHLQRILRYVFMAFIVSASVQIVMLPLLVLYFHRFSLASFVLNIWTGALVLLMSAAALVALVLAQISFTLALPFVWLTETANNLATYGVDPFVRVGLAGFRLAEYHGWKASVYALYFVPLLTLLVALALWRPVRGEFVSKQNNFRLSAYRNSIIASFVALCVLSFLIFTHPASVDETRGRLRVDFLDVGQGDAALLTLPDGATMLIDGGGRRRQQGLAKRNGDASFEEVDNEDFEPDAPRIGEAVVSEYLWWRGLKRIDYLLATHADADHIEGLNDVARNFRVRAALVGRTPSKDEEFEKFQLTLKGQDIPIEIIGAGDSLRFGAVTIDVLNPQTLATPQVISSNDDSIVLRVRYGQRSFIFTGDMEARAENLLTMNNEDLRSDVVKVAHHGSRTSSIESFVERTKPFYAVISVGQNSPYAHPSASVVERWQRGGAQVLTTGTSGTISISTDGRDLHVERFVNR